MSKTYTVDEVVELIKAEVSVGQPDDRFRLTAAFKGLRRLGYITKANFQCCGSCATADISIQMQKALGDKVKLDDLPFYEKKYVTWNRQSDDALDGRDLAGTLYINWGGQAYTIQMCLGAAGLRVSGGSSHEESIQVFPRPDQPHRYSPEVNVANQFCRVCARNDDDHRVWERQHFVEYGYAGRRRGYR